MRYGIGVGRPGFKWAGHKTVTRKAEWPDWTPPPEMLKRRPDLPRHMEGGPGNPLGARALYLGSSMYRIHGTNEPWTIGQNVSSGCIRMMNDDVIDLYERVKSARPVDGSLNTCRKPKGGPEARLLNFPQCKRSGRLTLGDAKIRPERPGRTRRPSWRFRASAERVIDSSVSRALSRKASRPPRCSTERRAAAAMRRRTGRLQRVEINETLTRFGRNRCGSCDSSG